MFKFLITGCSGFVAGHFVDYLQKKHNDIEVLGIASREHYEHSFENFTYKQLNMLDSESLTILLDEFKPDYIAHFAAISSVGQSWSEPVETFQNNTNIFLNLVESVRVLGLESRILSVGSSEVYAESTNKLCENSELAPKNPYAVARLAQEIISKLYTESYGLDIVMTRSFNHTGPKQADKFVISSFVKQIVEISQGADNTMYVGNIEVERDFLDVRDVVVAYYKLLMNGKTGDIYNVCSGADRKLDDVIKIASAVLNIDVNVEVDPARLRPNENPSIVGDNNKLCNELNWQPKYTFEQTVSDMIKYYKNDK